MQLWDNSLVNLNQRRWSNRYQMYSLSNPLASSLPKKMQENNFRTIEFGYYLEIYVFFSLPSSRTNMASGELLRRKTVSDTKISTMKHA